MTKRNVVVELSDEQVRDVVRAAVASRGPSFWQIELGLSQEALLDTVSHPLPAVVHGSMFSHSLARGLRVLAAFPSGHVLRGGAEIADELRMKKTTVHRYIATLAALGLLAQDPVTRRYRRTERQCSTYRTDDPHSGTVKRSTVIPRGKKGGRACPAGSAALPAAAGDASDDRVAQPLSGRQWHTHAAREAA
jgi:hypothetical protein